MAELGHPLTAAGLTDLSNVDIALRVEPPTVRRLAGIGVPTPAGNQLAIECPDRNAIAATLFNHVGHIAVEEDVARSNEVRPLGQEVAVDIENLDAVVLAVADVDPVVFVDTDLVENRELSRPRSGFAP